MQLTVRIKVLDVVVIWQIVGDLMIDQDRGLVGPASGHVSDRVPTSTENQQWQLEVLDESDTFAMGFDRKIETTKSVTSEGICSTLENDRGGPERVDHSLHHRLEQVDVRLIVNTVLKGNVQGVMFPHSATNLVNVSSAGEEITIVLVKGDGHNSIGGIKGLLDTVSVMDVNVHIEHSRVMSKKGRWME